MEPSNGPIQALYTPKQLVGRHTWLRLGTLREMLFNRDYNGLTATGAIIALSPRKLLINEQIFISWVNSHKVTPRK